MGRLQFMDLSTDIKTLVVQHVNRPTDLRNLCLTCQQLHEITVRKLYYEVTLDIGSANDNRLGAFLNPKNIGLPWIRKLDLYLATVPDACNQQQLANFTTRMILELLPENILEKFSWHPWSAFSGENLVLLYKKQKRMQWLEAIGLDTDVLDEIKKLPNLDQVFGNVKKLGLYPDSRKVLETSQLLLEHSHNLEKVTIHASFDDEIPARELNDSATEPGIITSTIFRHMQPFAECTPLALREIELHKINLRYASETYCKVVDFRTIKRIRVGDCPGADALFAELCRSTKLPERLELLEVKHDDNVENDGINAVDGFLCLVTGIKTLYLDFQDVKALPAPAGITRHAKTLKALLVHAATTTDSSSSELVYDWNSFSDICKSCSLLEQISVGFPAVSLIRQTQDSFINFQNCLGDLPDLTTMNVTTWPTNEPSGTMLPRKVYDHLLQGLAQSGFERSVQHATNQGRSSKLAIIAFGASNKIYEREETLNQVIFVKGKQLDLLGNEKPLAVQIGWSLRKFVDAGPKSDVLDFAISRSCRPPCREPPSSDESD